MTVLDAPAGAAVPAVRGQGLVPVFARLKLTLLRNGLRQSSGRRAAYIASLVVTLLLAVGQVIGLVALRGHAQAGTLVVLLTAVLALGWAVMPLFFPSGDETLDPKPAGDASAAAAPAGRGSADGLADRHRAALHARPGRRLGDRAGARGGRCGVRGDRRTADGTSLCGAGALGHHGQRPAADLAQGP